MRLRMQAAVETYESSAARSVLKIRLAKRTAGAMHMTISQLQVRKPNRTYLLAIDVLRTAISGTPPFSGTTMVHLFGLAEWIREMLQLSVALHRS